MPLPSQAASSYLQLITQGSSPVLKCQGYCDNFQDPTHAQTCFGKSSTYFFFHLEETWNSAPIFCSLVIVSPSVLYLTQSLQRNRSKVKSNHGIALTMHPHRNWSTGHPPAALRCLNTGVFSVPYCHWLPSRSNWGRPRSLNSWSANQTLPSSLYSGEFYTYCRTGRQAFNRRPFISSPEEFLPPKSTLCYAPGSQEC